MFDTKYTKRDSVPTCSGDRIAPLFSLKSKDAGVVELEVTGTKDLYAEIQSHADSCDIKTIISRYEMGDDTVLNKSNGNYIDVTDMPTNLAEVMGTVITATNQFNSLPLDVRKAYNFNVSEYIFDIGSEKWLSLVGNKDNEPIVPEDSPVEGGDPSES